MRPDQTNINKTVFVRQTERSFLDVCEKIFPIFIYIYNPIDLFQFNVSLICYMPVICSMIFIHVSFYQ